MLDNYVAKKNEDLKVVEASRTMPEFLIYFYCTKSAGVLEYSIVGRP